jgi:hypothetical protein
MIKVYSITHGPFLNEEDGYYYMIADVEDVFGERNFEEIRSKDPWDLISIMDDIRDNGGPVRVDFAQWDEPND